jgi:hypothetical protein
MLPIASQIEARQALLNALFVDSQRAGKPFTRDELERRMMFVAGAGVTDPDEFKRFVLSGDGA